MTAHGVDGSAESLEPSEPGADVQFTPSTETPVEPIEAMEVVEASVVPATVCARCRKSFPESEERCPFCLARNPLQRETRTSRTSAVAASHELRGIKILLVGFAVLLLSSVLTAIVSAAQAAGQQSKVEERASIIALEVIDTIIVLIVCWNLRTQPRPQNWRTAWTWLIAWPALAATLLLNVSYHELLHAMGVGVIRIPIDWDDPSDVNWTILLTCVQPAIIEELFFRGAAWRVFRGSFGPHLTVWLVAVMFGMAHIGAPLSIPILILIGALFGYAREYSGGLWLPMILHFVHNLVVILIDSLHS